MAWEEVGSLRGPDAGFRYVSVVTGTEARPNASVVIWIGGSTQPVNMADGDLWYAQSGSTEGPTLVAPTINTTSLNAMTQSQSFIQNLSVTGSSPILWTITAGTIPAGLSLSSTGIVSGTPTGTGAYSFTATATNGAGSDAQVFSGSISAAPVVGPPPEGLTVFGTETKGVTFGAYNDGGSLQVLNGFYTYGSGVANATAVGMRVYVPAGMSIPSSGTAYIFSPPSGNPPVLSMPTAPVVSAPITGLVAGQWNDVAFPSATPLTAGLPVYIGYSFDNGAYVASTSGTIASEPIVSTPAGVAFMEDPASVAGQPWDRSLYRPNNGDWGTSPTGPSYGVDIIVSGV